MTPDLFAWQPPARYPDAPGQKERNGTSQAAAEAMAPRQGTLQAMALEALRNAPGGLTPDEIADVWGVHFMSMRPRLTELDRKGFVTKTTMKRRNATSGKDAAVYVIRTEVAG